MKSRSGILNIVKNGIDENWHSMEHFPHKRVSASLNEYLDNSTVFRYVYEPDVRLQIERRPYQEHTEPYGWNENDLKSNITEDSCSWDQLRLLYDGNLVHLTDIFVGDSVAFPSPSIEFTDESGIDYAYLTKESYELACGLSNILLNPNRVNTSEDYLNKANIRIED